MTQSKLLWSQLPFEHHYEEVGMREREREREREKERERERERRGGGGSDFGESTVVSRVQHSLPDVL
jgi:hypothetical protein